jgi:hypothetical protein
MKRILTISAWLALSAFVLALAACGGGGPATVGSLPVFPGAQELKAGDNPIGTTLANNGAQDQAMRKSMGVGGKTEQKGYKLPADATWDAVKSFYEKELKSAGWDSGLGGVAGQFADVNAMMNAGNQGNDMVPHSILFSKSTQTLTVIMQTLPLGDKEKHLILSLSTR